MDITQQEILQNIQSIDVEQERAVHTLKVDYITEELDYDDFFLRYLLPNKPCVLGSHVTSSWRSRTEWVTADGQPDFDFLADHFGNVCVPVADCDRVQYYAQPKHEMKLSEYMEYWKTHVRQDSPDKCLYLKDWHFVHVFPDYQAYKTPVYFSYDWLNEFWDQRSDRVDDDYRFVYMGPKGSWTPFHADVFRSFSWSANICGRKKWLLYPPGEEEHLKDHLGNLAYDVTSSDLHDEKKYPNVAKACQPFEVIQEAGEVIFVPSGWHHQVFNLEDTISINHNWLNGCSLDIMWGFLQQELKTVQESINDCIDMDGWHAQCQLIMKASTGIDYAEFFLFLHTIATQRLELLKNRTDSKPINNEKGLECKESCKTQGADTKLSCTSSIVESMYMVPERNVVETKSDAWTRKVVSSVSEPSSDKDIQNRTTSEELSSIDETISSRKYERTASETPADRGNNEATFISPRQGQGLSVTTDNSSKVFSRTTETEKDSACQLSCQRNEQGAHCLWHVVFDLQRIKSVLQSLISNIEFQELDSSTLCDDPKKLYDEICSVIEGFS